MIGLAPQNIDDAACLIPLLVLIGEERAYRSFDDPAASGVLLQRLLHGPHEQVALRPIIEDYSKPGVYVAVLVAERLLHRRDIGFLAAQDIEPPRRDLGLVLEPPGLPQARAEFLLNLLEQRIEAVEILAFLTVGDLLGGTLVRSRSYVTEFCDVGWLDDLHPELRQKFVIVAFIGRAG